MLPIFYVLIAVIGATALVGAVLFIRRLTQAKYERFVLQNSICLRQVDEINGRYRFYPSVDFDETHTYDNEKFFDTISCEDYLIYRLQEIGQKVVQQINKISANKKAYEKYLDEIKCVSSFGRFTAPSGKLSAKRLSEVERRLMKEHVCRTPATEFYLTVTLLRSSMNGRVYDRKRGVFTAADIKVLNERLNDKSGNFYNDRKIWDALCRVERGKVSNKLRFSVYERDGYRCRKCGVSDGYAQLEIDHILPIAKGGKSVYDNLQTLCRRCNTEKGDAYIKYR